MDVNIARKKNASNVSSQQETLTFRRHANLHRRCSEHAIMLVVCYSMHSSNIPAAKIGYLLDWNAFHRIKTMCMRTNCFRICIAIMAFTFFFSPKLRGNLKSDQICSLHSTWKYPECIPCISKWITRCHTQMASSGRKSLLACAIICLPSNANRIFALRALKSLPLVHGGKNRRQRKLLP